MKRHEVIFWSNRNILCLDCGSECTYNIHSCVHICVNMYVYMYIYIFVVYINQAKHLKCVHFRVCNLHLNKAAIKTTYISLVSPCFPVTAMAHCSWNEVESSPRSARPCTAWGRLSPLPPLPTMGLPMGRVGPLPRMPSAQLPGPCLLASLKIVPNKPSFLGATPFTPQF